MMPEEKEESINRESHFDSFWRRTEKESANRFGIGKYLVGEWIGGIFVD